MKEGEIYTAQSGKQYVSVSDTVDDNGKDLSCEICDCRGKGNDCIEAPCFNNNHFKLKEGQQYDESKLIQEISTWAYLANTLTQEHQQSVRLDILHKVHNLKLQLSEIKQEEQS